MDTRRLRNSDMKRLVRILRGVPIPADKHFERKETSYRKHTREYIHTLPSRLRSSRLSLGSTNLCSTHKGLNTNLIDDIWQWLRHEFEGAIGKFLYPLIMSSRLTAEQEWKARQVEPVLQMWKLDFSLETSAPLGHQPISCGSQWVYQRDGCSACIMARIGSDEKVLFALFANMVGRFNTKSLGSIGGWDKTRSKRIRFVRYWVKTTRGGDITLAQAGELGLMMKRQRHRWKDEQRAHLQSLVGTTVQDTSQTILRPSFDSQRTKAVDENRHHGLSLPSLHSAKLGPEPRLNDSKAIRSSTSTQRLVSEHQPYSPASPTSTIRPARSVATSKRVDEPAHTPNPSIQSQPHSLATNSTFATIASYTGGPSAVAHLYDPLDNPFYNALPEPERSSIYSQFGNREFDGGRFDRVDEELKGEEMEEWEKEVGEEDDDDEGKEGSDLEGPAWDDMYNGDF
ncbi:hypothetical protein GMOD_00008397 [Pyrenophora seminiperda CCB06]|uniref:Uncharacterized protein n=1 Tax=Pyrenophora seminiperda CCB06 TaxID=1302712 RepID=A0A3M7M8J0_9PLEO|nr:hypothetical protein GMOD_00008397 [Pyrenophora seminiperda CCB06]